MASYYCSPRSHWFEPYQPHNDPERTTVPLCTCLCSPLQTCRVHSPRAAKVGHYSFTPKERVSDEDVDRIARRVAELLKTPA